MKVDKTRPWQEILGNTAAAYRGVSMGLHDFSEFLFRSVFSQPCPDKVFLHTFCLLGSGGKDIIPLVSNTVCCTRIQGEK